MTIDDAGSFAHIRALSSRAPGYAVAQKCLEVQAAAEQLDPSLRTERGVRLHPDAWSWYVGAQGEMYVGALLAKLGPEWLVRHAVPIGAGTKDIDHLVIGPPGVFAINSKHHSGASVWVGDHVLRVNNANTGHLRDARADAADASRRLSAKAGMTIVAYSVVAIVGARALKDIRESDAHHPYVVSADQLVRWLQSLPSQMQPGELGLVQLAAEEPGTWHVDPNAADTYRVMQRFERLRAAIEAKPVAPSRPGRPPAGPQRSRASAASPTTRRRNKRGRSRVVGIAQTLIVLGFALFLMTHPQEVGQFLTGIMTSSFHAPPSAPPTP